MEKVWQANLEVNLLNIKHNINEINKIIGKDVTIMPIIKDNAYGTNINQNVKFFEECNIKIVGVAIVDEGINLRQIGHKEEILILNQPLEEEIENIIKYNLTVGIGSIEFLKKLGNRKENIKIHMEIGTGMGRTGIHPNHVKDYLNELKKYPNIELEGIYTHFSSSDTDEEYTKSQIRLFNKAVEEAKNNNINFKYIHCCNSAATILFKEAHYNTVRPGLIIYGYYPVEELKSKIDLKPSISLKSKISFIKEVDEGTSISYGRSYITDKKMKIGTVPLGYGDGIRRCMSNRGKVVINGRIIPIIGKICMDCFMVDASDISDIKVGDEVHIWDNNIIKLEDIAQIYDTINYEVIVGISQRVVRKYIE